MNDGSQSASDPLDEHDVEPIPSDGADFVRRYWRSAPKATTRLNALQADSIDDATFRLLADNIPTLCWVANGDGYIVWYNRRWHDYCGTTAEQMEGWGWQSVHDPDLLPSVMERWTLAVANGEPFEMTFPLRGADGAFRPFLTRVQPMRDASGAVARWFGTNTDIYDQVSAEEALRGERDRSRGVLEGMTEGFVLLDRKFRLLDINAEGLRIDGRGRDEMIGRSHWEVWPGSETTDQGELYKRVMVGGGAEQMETYHQWDDGREVWLDVRAYPHPEGVAIFYRDIGDRKQAQLRIQESEAFTRLLLDSTSEAFYSVDRQGTTTLCNDAFLRLLGFETREAVVGRKLHDVIHHSHPDGLPYPSRDCPIYQAASQGRSAFVSDELFFRLDGSSIPVEYRAEPIVVDGELLGAICTFYDIVDRKIAERALAEQARALETLNETLEARVLERTAELEKAQDALRQAQKMEAVGQLTGGIAHDFNNMLTVVVGSLDMLGRRLGTGDARSKRYIDAAADGARRAALLTQRLLAFSRQQPLRPEPIDVNKLVTGMSELIRGSLGSDVRLETVLVAGGWRVHADPNQLENVLLNLAVNARDAMPDGGRLTIDTQNAHIDAHYAALNIGVPAGQYVLVAVTDTGSGMSQEVIAKAFDPFFTTKEVGKGTGLGLSQAYGFVKQSGGHVKIYSEPGQGTTVKIYLPRLIAADYAADDKELISALPLGESGEVILVVEDEPAVRQFSVEALTELGYRVIEADGAETALRLLELHPEVALMFTDVVMPDVNGRKLADEVLKRRPDIRILFTTGYTRNAVVHNGVLDAGVEMIGKPFTVDELAAKVREVLDAPLRASTS